MKSSVESINSVQRRVFVTVQTAAVNEAFNEAYRKLQGKAVIRGFRRGKAPLHLIRKLYGSNVSADVGEKLIHQNLFKAIEENGVRPIAPPYVEVSDGPFMDTEYAFSAIVDVMPKIEIGDAFGGLAVTTKRYQVGDDSCQKELVKLARSRAKVQPLPEGSPAEAGSAVKFHQELRVDGEIINELSAREQMLVLGEETQQVIPGIADALQGVCAGMHKSVPVNFPDDHPLERIAGRQGTAEVEVVDVSQLEIPAIDDEFAKDLDHDDLDALQKSVSDRLKSQAESMTISEKEGVLLDAFSQRVSFEVPPAIVDQVIDSMISEFKLPPESLEKAKKDEEFRKSLRPRAKKQAQNTILLLELAKQKELAVTDEDIKAHIKNGLGDGASEAELERMLQKYREKFRENLLFAKALELLTNSATITYEDVVV